MLGKQNHAQWQCQVCWFWQQNVWLNPGLYFVSHCLEQLSFPDLKNKNCCTDDKGFPGDISGKESACQYRKLRDTSLILGLGRSPGGRHGNLLQYSCLENPMDRGAWRILIRRVTKSWKPLKQHSRHTHIQIKNIWDLFPMKLFTNLAKVHWDNWHALKLFKTFALIWAISGIYTKLSKAPVLGKIWSVSRQLRDSCQRLYNPGSVSKISHIIRNVL